MRAVLQRVSQASVRVDGAVVGQIDAGLLVLLCAEKGDTDAVADKMLAKMLKLRIFSDDAGKMNLSVQDVGGGLLVVSQFTLHASTKKGNRPSFIRAARPEAAIPLYEGFILLLQKELGKPVATGQFGADMRVALENDGPVTIWIDSKARE